jgi:hypothetical protein
MQGFSIPVIGMTCFMTYSVYSLNFSNLFPQQSEYVMTVTFYFMLSMAWTLLSMGWFVLCNHYTAEAKMPKPLDAFCGLLQRVFVCCFSKPKDEETPLTKLANALENGKSDGDVNEATEEGKSKCSFCDRCEPCLTDYKKDKAKGKKKKDIESKCSALNYFIFLWILLFMFVANMVLWFSMAN